MYIWFHNSIRCTSGSTAASDVHLVPQQHQMYIWFHNSIRCTSGSTAASDVHLVPQQHQMYIWFHNSIRCTSGSTTASDVHLVPQQHQMYIWFHNSIRCTSGSTTASQALCTKCNTHSVTNGFFFWFSFVVIAFKDRPSVCHTGAIFFFIYFCPQGALQLNPVRAQGSPQTPAIQAFHLWAAVVLCVSCSL